MHTNDWDNEAGYNEMNWITKMVAVEYFKLMTEPAKSKAKVFWKPGLEAAIGYIGNTEKNGIMLHDMDYEYTLGDGYNAEPYVPFKWKWSHAANTYLKDYKDNSKPSYWFVASMYYPHFQDGLRNVYGMVNFIEVDVPHANGLFPSDITNWLDANLGRDNWFCKRLSISSETIQRIWVANQEMADMFAAWANKQTNN